MPVLLKKTLKALLTQPCSFMFLAYWLGSLEKMFLPAGIILRKLFSPPYFPQPPEAVSVGRGLQRDKAKVAGGIVASHRPMPHLDQGEFGQQQPCLLPIFAAGRGPVAKPPNGRQSHRRARKHRHHELAISQLPRWPFYIWSQKSVEDRGRKKSHSLREHSRCPDVESKS